MLRDTITRLKRVCAIAFVPRLMRGELRYIPGKFEKFTYVIQKTAQKSTKCSKPTARRRIRRKVPEDPLKYAVSSVCENSVKSEYSDIDSISNYQVIPGKDLPNPNETPDNFCKDMSARCCEKCVTNVDSTPSKAEIKALRPINERTTACRCAECRRVIDKIFGESDPPMKYERNVSGDLLSSVARVYMKTDSGTSKLVADNRIQPNAYNIPETNAPKLEKKVTPKEDNTLVKDLRIRPNTGPVLMNQKDERNIDTIYSSLYDVAPEEGKSLLSNEQKEKKKPLWSYIYETAYDKNSLNYEPNMSIDTDTLKMFKSLMDKNTLYKETEPGKVKNESIERLKTLSGTDLISKSVVTATASKTDEEKLTQKIENIEETPLVEAEKSKVDGFNIKPKILTNVEKEKKITDNTLDEIAKRCLTSKHKQVDEILLREMDKLGIPITTQKDSLGLKSNDQFNLINKSENRSNPPSEQESDINANKENRLNQDIFDSKESRKISDVSKQTTIPQCFLDSKADTSTNIKESKTKGPETTVSTPDIMLTKKIWGSELNPKHVLTCNETCPISPKPLSDHSWSDLKGTQAIYERDFLANKENKIDNSRNETDRLNLVHNRWEPIERETILEEEFNKSTSKKSVSDVLNQSMTAASTTIAAATGTDKQSLIDNADTSTIHAKQPKKSDHSLSSSGDGGNHTDNRINDTRYQAIDLDRLEFATEQLRTTSEQLLVTSEKLLATSDQLESTSEQLQAATVSLEATSAKLDLNYDKFVSIQQSSYDKLNKVSDKLQNSSEKLETLTENLESTNEKLHDLCDNFQQIALTQLSRSADKNTTITSTQSVIPSLLTSVFGSSFKNTNTQPPFKNHNNDKVHKVSNVNAQNIPSDATCSKFASITQPGVTMNPMTNTKNDFSSMLGPLPQVNEKTKLSELMKIVKQRNKLIETSNYLNASKSGKKNIPPLSLPMQNTPVKIITPGYPELKRSPRKGVPKGGKPKVKFSKCDLKTLENYNPSRFNRETDGLNILANDVHQGISVTLLDLDPPSELKDEIATKLKTLNHVLKCSYEQRKIEALEAVMLARTHHKKNRPKLFRTKNFDPWVPLPSWPLNKSQKRPKLQCPKEGCKSLPPTRAERDPSCGLRPCDTFPTLPKRKFCQLDYLTIFLSDDTSEVVDF